MYGWMTGWFGRCIDIVVLFHTLTLPPFLIKMKNRGYIEKFIFESFIDIK